MRAVMCTHLKLREIADIAITYLHNGFFLRLRIAGENFASEDFLGYVIYLHRGTSHLMSDGLILVAVFIVRALFAVSLSKPCDLVLIKVKVAQRLACLFVKICVLTGLATGHNITLLSRIR